MATEKEVSAMHGPDRLSEIFGSMTEAEVMTLWRFGGFAGTPPRDRDRLICAMARGVTRNGRRSVGRAFVRAFRALRPEVRAALLLLLLVLQVRPAGIDLPTQAPRALSPQRRCHRFTPARAP